tara:strand:- start:436 stop:1380 length:945 start_codon:yes stop_codon:yes gene_type:complete
MTNKLTIFEPQNLEEAFKFAETLSKSQLIPDTYRGKPQDILVCMQWGSDLGLKPLQALSSISVINGKASVWGDGLVAVCRQHPSFMGMEEWQEDKTAYCKVKRKYKDQIEETISSFSMEQAEKAHLLNRPTWKTYPERMLKMRARGFALRDAFADALKGIISAEEAEDYPTEPKKAVQPVKVSNSGNIANNIVNAITDDSTEENDVVENEEKILEEPISVDGNIELKMMNKPSKFFSTWEDWLDDYKDIMNRVYTSSKYDNAKKRTLLKEFEQLNNVTLNSKIPEEQCSFVKQTRLDFNKALSTQINENENGTD